MSALHPGNIGRFIMLLCFIFMLICGFYAKNMNLSAAGRENLTSKYSSITFITCAWFCMFYMFLFHQSYVHHCVYIKMVGDSKKNDKKEFINLKKLKAGNYDDESVLVVNTTVRNTIEQSLTFLPLLWLCAALGGDSGVDHSTIAGWTWVIARFFYPILYDMGMPWLLLSTLTGYAAQLYLAWHLTRAVQWPM
jgi:hypothetical protein